MRHSRATAVATAVGLVATALTAVALTTPTASAANGPAWPIDTYGVPWDTDNAVLTWNEQLLATIRANPGATGPTISARALGVLHTSMYDAWAAYDAKAVPTQQPDGWARQPDGQRTEANKAKAVSFAAYRTLVDLFPGRKAVYLAALGGDEAADSPAETVGDAAAQANLDFRHADGSNQLDGYVDTTGYQARNTWNTVTAPWSWQPLCVLTATGVANKMPSVRDPNLPCPDTSTPANYTVQRPLTPQWKTIKSFGDLNWQTRLPHEFDNQPFNPPKLADGSYDPADVDQALRDTSSLTDAQKVTAEYWADGPGSEFPPGHMAVFAQALSRMRGNTLDQDVKLFFTLGNALMDASISAWAVKFDQDYWRPVTAIRYRYANKQVNSWLGPGKGYGKVLGRNWQPYQALNVVTPAFPEYVSGHSTFSAAGRTVLLAFFGTDAFNAKVTIRKGTSKIEAGVPSKDVVLSWNTLTAAADEAGMSRRYGGIHFASGDQHGRSLGRVIGYNDWTKAQTFFNGTAGPIT
jgi:PAP2 superfamily